MQDNVRNPERGEIKQSVCKHCGEKIFHEAGVWWSKSPSGLTSYAACQDGKIEVVRHEPVAESVSTGEPECDPEYATLKHTQLEVERESRKLFEAARPSGPSAPQTSAEPCPICGSTKSPHAVGLSCHIPTPIREINEFPAAPQPVPRADDPEHPIVGPEDGSPCCEHCAKHPGSQWTLKVSQPVSGDALHKCALEKDGCGTEPKSTPNGVAAGFTHGDAPKVEEVTDSLIAFFNSSTIQDADIRNEVAAILRPYFPPVSQTENTLFQKVITFLESCRDKAKAECGIYLTANHFETILESLKLATPASTAREPKDTNGN